MQELTSHYDDAFEPMTGTTPGTNLSYLMAGSGPPVVLLHGWGAFKELWWSTLKVLAPSYTAVALDWPGHGSPPLPIENELFDTLVSLTIAACAELHLERIALVGHSLGGNVAARVALARPDLVACIVLVDAAIDKKYFWPGIGLLVHPRWGEHLLRLNRRIERPLVRLGTHVPHEHRGGVIRPWARRAHYMAKHDIQILYQYLVALHQASLTERLTAIQQPTLVITGARDRLIHPAQAEALARLIPQAELVVIRGAYHTPMDEQPVAFQRALLNFLAKHLWDQ